MLSAWLLPLQVVYPDAQTRVEYKYDRGGNLVSIKAGSNLGPPDVTELTPAYINRENTSTIIATGINLFGASVTSNNPELTVTNVTSISTEALSFTLRATSAVPIGLSPLVFSNSLGSDTESIIVAQRIPIISTDPNPIILKADGVLVTVTLEFDLPFAQDQVFDLSMADAQIAELQDVSFTLLAGQTSVSTEITGLSIGNTLLQITQLSNFLAIKIPVFVTDNTFPSGTHSAYSRGVGVAIYTDSSAETTTQFVSAPVGIAIYTESSAETTTQFVSAPVGVAIYTESSTETTTQFVSAPVGVAIYTEQSAETTSLFPGNPVGVNMGAVVTDTVPAQLTQGNTAAVVLHGLNLNLVDAIEFSPSAGITQIQPFAVNQAGSELTLHLDISGSAALGDRLILITTAPDSEFSEISTFQIIAQ